MSWSSDKNSGVRSCGADTTSSEQVKHFAEGNMISSIWRRRLCFFIHTYSRPVRGFQLHDVNIHREQERERGEKKSKFSSVRSCCCEITAGRFSEDDRDEKKIILIHFFANSFRREMICVCVIILYVHECICVFQTMSALIWVILGKKMIPGLNSWIIEENMERVGRRWREEGKRKKTKTDKGNARKKTKTKIVHLWKLHHCRVQSGGGF